MVINLGYFGPWISDKEDFADENAEIKIEVIENDIELKTEPEFIDLQTNEESYQVCTFHYRISLILRQMGSVHHGHVGLNLITPSESHDFRFVAREPINLYLEPTNLFFY